MRRHPTLELAFCAVTSLTFLTAALSPAVAQAARGSSVANEAQWLRFDPEAETITVEILKASRGNKALAKQFKKKVKRGKQATFNVIPTGSILKRTSVAINGRKAELTEIEPGKRVVIYWTEDPNRPGELFARKIDVVFSEQELRERYGSEE